MDFENFFSIAFLALTQGQINAIIKPIEEVINLVVPALLGLVGTVGALWCIVLGVNFAKASDPQEHEKAKKALVNAIVGFVLIFVLLIMLKVGATYLPSFYKDYVVPQA